MGPKDYKNVKIMKNTSLPAVDRPNADRWNGARSRQLEKGIFTKKLYTFTKTQTPLQGPVSSLDHMGIVYTCQFHRCVIHCPCQICCDRRPTCKRFCQTEVCSECNQQCIQHEIKHPRAFDPETDTYTMVTDKIDKYQFVQPYAGIPSNCKGCTRDVLEHQLYHMVYHLRCRLCSAIMRQDQT